MIYPYIDRIRKIRKNHNLSQDEVARLLGTSQTMYSRYERGLSEMPIRHLVMLADYYRISADYILGRTDIM
ncbi:MAG: helix-turn-helix transcriptional regulator [Eubacterium sp.]|nr:helix-turn-helix transcriptional regulator [Eubacterium sp.]